MRVVACLLLVACGGPPRYHGDDIIDACVLDRCDPYAQSGCPAGEKCTWVNGASPVCGTTILCVPDGTVAIGQPCAFGSAGPDGYDNCVAGSVCSTRSGPAVCRALCDFSGTGSECGSGHACFPDSDVYVDTSGRSVGVCLDACDPLADNDFDGSGSAFTRAGSACGSAIIGCHGYVGVGSLAPTRFGCLRDEHYDLALRHRTECTVATGCASTDSAIDFLACSQGYMPLLTESTAVTKTVCIALCKPLDCYAGSCGSNNTDRLGAAPHRCTVADAVGTFGSGEECHYFRWLETDGQTWVPSPFSDTLGFCFDHTKYGLPACQDLPLHGSGSGYDAVSLGCVSSVTAGLP